MNDRIGLIAGKWHEMFVERLIDGAQRRLQQGGISEEKLISLRCPGSFELPQAASKLAARDVVDGILCLGVLIRGETPHFDYIAAETARGIGRTAQQYRVPVSFGVLTCDTMEQAMARSGSKAGNKGVEAADALLEMLELYDRIEAIE